MWRLLVLVILSSWFVKDTREAGGGGLWNLLAHSVEWAQSSCTAPSDARALRDAFSNLDPDKVCNTGETIIFWFISNYADEAKVPWIQMRCKYFRWVEGRNKWIREEKAEWSKEQCMHVAMDLYIK